MNNFLNKLWSIESWVPIEWLQKIFIFTIFNNKQMIKISGDNVCAWYWLVIFLILKKKGEGLKCDCDKNKNDEKKAKSNNHLSPSLTEPKTLGTTTYDVGFSGAGLGQSQKRGGVKSFKRIQTLPSGLPTANTYIKQMIKNLHRFWLQDWEVKPVC